MPQNSYITTPFTDILKPKVVDKRTGEEIAMDVMKRAGLKFG